MFCCLPGMLPIVNSSDVSLEQQPQRVFSAINSVDQKLTLCTLTCTLFPNLDGAVVAAGGHPLAGRIKRQTPDSGSVSFQGGLALPVVVLFLVHADVVVVAGRGQELRARGATVSRGKRDDTNSINSRGPVGEERRTSLVGCHTACLTSCV